MRLLRTCVPFSACHGNTQAENRITSRNGATKAGLPCTEKLQEEYQYAAINMCAADGVCSISIACPISIDTGKVMKGFRSAQTTRTAQKVALSGAQKWDVVEKLVRGGVISAHALGTNTIKVLSDTARGVINPDILPTIPGELPKAAQRLPST
ncbi:hypothetical protein [Corynebacterium silvaticum]|uniref:hypothetical protein n=1 Tax=Corynebacterium silvaticum TaxID=2320431 RepID=UPI001E2FA3AE|nr:hypothetical protein [Corynebacterium silvaticum]